MAAPGDFRCERCGGDVSSLRVVVRESVWYLLDVTDEGVYPHQSPDGDARGGSASG